MKKAVSALALLVTIGAGAQIGQAQSLSRILAKSGLSPEDFTMMNEAASSLYDTASPKAGQSASWKNDESGSFGTVKLTTVRDNCAYLLHKTNPKGKDTVTEIKNRFCKTADGQWQQQP